MYRVLGCILCDLDGVTLMGQGQIMYFLVNGSPLKPLDEANSKVTSA